MPGTISYILENTNNDNSASIIPPGMTLDPITGEIAGRVPYQPAVSKEYKFTVSAVRAGTGSDLVTVIITPYEDQQQGGDELKIQKLPVGLTDGLDDLQSLIGEKNNNQ